MNKDSKERLWAQYSPLVKCWAKKMGEIDYATDDWMQEAYLIFVRAYETYNEVYEIGFGAYYRMVLYRYGSLYRKRTQMSPQRWNEWNDQDISAEDEIEASVETLIVDGMCLVESSRRLQYAMAQLGAKDQDILTRFYYHRQPIAGIAAFYGISVAALESRKRRAIKKLKKIYEKATDF